MESRGGGDGGHNGSQRRRCCAQAMASATITSISSGVFEVFSLLIASTDSLKICLRTASSTKRERSPLWPRPWSARNWRRDLSVSEETTRFQRVVTVGMRISPLKNCTLKQINAHTYKHRTIDRHSARTSQMY